MLEYPQVANEATKVRNRLELENDIIVYVSNTEPRFATHTVGATVLGCLENVSAWSLQYLSYDMSMRVRDRE